MQTHYIRKNGKLACGARSSRASAMDATQDRQRFDEARARNHACLRCVVSVERMDAIAAKYEARKLT